MLGWLADYPDPQDFLTLLWGPDAAAHGDNFNNETATDAWTLLAQADADQNATERYALYNQAEQLLVNEVAGNAWANVQILAH